MVEGHINISVSIDTHAKLTEEKIVERESFNDVIKRLLDEKNE